MPLINCDINLDLNWSENCVIVAGFKRTINWNKYQPKVSSERPNQYLDFLIDSGFQGVNRLFILPFESEAQRTS